MQIMRKYFGIIVVDDELCYTFAANLKISNIHNLNNKKNYVLDIGISVKTGGCTLAGN
jgi:hypothetical protein